MGRKKKKRTYTKKTMPVSSVAALPQSNTMTFAQLNLSESYISLLIGLFVVVFGSFLAISLLRGRVFNTVPQPRKEISSDKTTQKEEKLPIASEYTVVEGDDLKQISLKFYNTEDNWTVIAEANNIADPTQLQIGAVLKIPKVQLSQSENQTVLGQQEVPASERITGTSYTVKEGEGLWDIALRAYGDGFKWTTLVEYNKLQNPDYVEPGTVLKIPR